VTDRGTMLAAATERLFDLTLDRFAWMERAAEQIRQWRAEDEANGIFWNDTPKEGGLSASGPRD
jgi:hypothetical protein